MSHKSARDLNRRERSAVTSSLASPLRARIVEPCGDALLASGLAGHLVWRAIWFGGPSGLAGHHHKQLAQKAVRAAMGVVELANPVRFDRRHESSIVR